MSLEKWARFFDTLLCGRRYIILEDFINWLMGRQDDNQPAEGGLNPLDVAASAIQDSGQVPVQQAPITINLEAPKRSGRGPKSGTGGGSPNQDATLEALALSRTAQTPNTNWRSSGAREREKQQLTTGAIRKLVQQGRGSAGTRGGRQR